MIPSREEIMAVAKKLDPNRPIVVITPVNRYLGFSAPLVPTDQFGAIAKNWGFPVIFKDPQKLHIELDPDNLPKICDENGEVNGSVYFPFGHSLLDRTMVMMIVTALEKSGASVINGSKALTIADDKALMAIALSNNKDIPTAKSAVTSARSSSAKIIDFLTESQDETLIAKMSGFTAGGVGIQPIPADVNYLAPAMWLSRMNERPRVIQNDVDKSSANEPRTVIRAYVVGGEVVGCYTTKGYGIVNCAGLARESEGVLYEASKEEKEVFVKAAAAVQCSGFCRIDAVGNKKLSILEINPLARIDAEKYGLQIAEEILWYAAKLAISKQI
jgi:glutathione synthase/RimK-type ligase-like ATP-grasp enzyme